MNHQAWFLLGCFFILLEIGHPGLLYFLTLAFGSGIACIAGWYDYSLFVQYAVFFIFSCIAMGLVYLLIRFSDIRPRGSHRSNTDLLLGKVVTVVELQSSTVGQGKLGGEMWLIKLQVEGELKVGMKVAVVGVQGCHLQVRIVNHN